MTLTTVTARCYIDRMSTGKKITQLREEIGISQRELARRIDVHYQSVGRWERDESLPDTDALIKLAALFKVTTDYILFDNTPRDGKVDITDIDLLNLFETASQLDDEKRAVVKKLIKAFVFTEKFAEEFTGKVK